MKLMHNGITQQEDTPKHKRKFVLKTPSSWSNNRSQMLLILRSNNQLSLVVRHFSFFPDGGEVAQRITFAKTLENVCFHMSLVAYGYFYIWT